MNYHTPDKHHVDYDPSEHQSRVLMGDPKALAYEWICGYAANLTDQVRNSYDYAEYEHSDVTVDELLHCADTQQPDEKGRSSWDYIQRGGAFEGEGVDPTFWDKYAILRGIERDKVQDSGFFSCSC